MLPSGSFRALVYAGTDPLTGEDLRLRETCRTRAEAHVHSAGTAQRATAALAAEGLITVSRGKRAVVAAGSRSWSA